MREGWLQAQWSKNVLGSLSSLPDWCLESSESQLLRFRMDEQEGEATGAEYGRPSLPASARSLACFVAWELR
jgi:hypothetical protein